MAIPRPVTKTIIDSVVWGIPITDEVNRLTTSTAPGAWTAPAFQNGWLNYDVATADILSYRKLGDMIQIRGVIKSGTVGVTVANLPAGFRPLKNCSFPVIGLAASSTLPASSFINTAGDLKIYDAAPTPAYIHLGIIQFSLTA